MTVFFDFVPGAALITLLALVACLPLLWRIKGLKWWRLHIANRRTVRLFLRRHGRRKLTERPDLSRPDLTPQEMGLAPSDEERALDMPLSNWSPERCDGVHFVGFSSDGHAVDLCIWRTGEEAASVWVVLRGPDGSVYTLPPHHDTRRPYVARVDTFCCSGLQIRCLSPLRRWRISFNGLLQRRLDPTDENCYELVHTRFSFVWLAMSGLQEQNLSYPSNELADAFTKENRAVGERDLLRLQGLQDRCEQWGQMVGTVTFGGEEPSELYLWSIRTRLLGSPPWKDETCSARYYMYFVDGVPLKLETTSVRDLVSNLSSGFTISPMGGVRHVSRCCFGAPLELERDKEIQLSFVLAGETKTIRVTPDIASEILYTGPDLQQRLTLVPFTARMDGAERGHGMLHYALSSTAERGKVFRPPPLLLKDPGYLSCQKSVLLLEDELCCSALIAGGKGSSLALLTKLARKTQQFVVPKGFVITTTAFDDHVKAKRDVSDAILKLKDVSCGINEGDLKTECDRCVKTFMTSKLSEQLKSEIESILSNTHRLLQDIWFSVRSSAYGEDGEDLSAAGQMLTVLGIRGIEKIFRAVVECWSSKFGFEAVQYARQNGQSLVSPMAVVVQEMVPSEFSGVLFTVDPVTGDPSRPHLTANFGLGETVVSALADPDTIVLQRGEDQSLQVSRTSVGSKKTKVFMTAGDGVERKNYESQSQVPCLTDEWAVKIGNAGILVEWCFCSPRDIEWAVHDGHLFLLQARPITTLHTETDFELTHDQDTPVRSIHDFWTRANTGEVFPGATSPLGMSLVVAGMDLYNHRQHVMRDHQPSDYTPYFFHILPATHRQICINVVDTLFRSNEREVTTVQRAFEAALFGRPVITDDIHRAGIRKYGLASRRKKFLLFLFIPMVASRVPKTFSRLEKMVSEYRVPLERFSTARQAWEGVMAQMNFYAEVCGVHGLVTFLSTYFNMMLMTILAKGKTEWDSELYCDFATMLSSCSGMESAGVPESLQELAQTIARELGDSFSSLPADDAYELLRHDSGESSRLFGCFLRQHGHRCVKEFDVYSKSWGMQPESLMPTLQNMVNATSVQGRAAPREALTTEAILAKIKTPISSFNRRVLKFLLPRSRRYVCQREKTKSMLIKSVDWLRKSCYHLGRMMVREGMLPDDELVFFLTLDEVEEILDSQKPGLVGRAVRRKRLHTQLCELKMPEIMEGVPRPVPAQADPASYAASFTLRGTPVCQGVVRARAVVVVSLDGASQIKGGDILVTHATDIGWSPYFPLLSGVVTVLGGLISHGAVIAREFGLPCVVGVVDATTALKTGDMVVLNGTEGTVTKVADP